MKRQFSQYVKHITLKNLISYLLLSILLFSPFGASFGLPESTLELSRFPSLISSIQITSPLDFCGEQVPLHDPDIRERLEREMLLAMWNRPQVILWLKRAGRYFPHIEEVLRQNGMPDDLKYISIAESGLLAHIGSHKRAIGFWQFLKPTGRSYGLRIDGTIDERRNIFSSTQAAAKYLEKLYADFDSWTLAAAGYNMGEGGLKARISAQKTENYYQLYIPRETQRYLFKILAVKLIMSNPEKYGFYLAPEDLYSPLSFDRVQVRVSNYLPLRLIADAASTYFKRIRDLNPEIRAHGLPAGTYSLLIPKGAGKMFHGRLAPLVAKYRPKRTHKSYVVRAGDNLSGIARKHGVRTSDLKRWNKSLRNRKYIHPGQRLIIHEKRAIQ